VAENECKFAEERDYSLLLTLATTDVCRKIRKKEKKQKDKELDTHLQWAHTLCD